MDLDFFEDTWWYEQTWGWKISPDKTFFKKEFHIKIHEDFLSSCINSTGVNKDYFYNKTIYLPFNYENNKLIVYKI
jgi:hypothetical protein